AGADAARAAGSLPERGAARAAPNLSARSDCESTAAAGRPCATSAAAGVERGLRRSFPATEDPGRASSPVDTAAAARKSRKNPARPRLMGREVRPLEPVSERPWNGHLPLEEKKVAGTGPRFTCLHGRRPRLAAIARRVPPSRKASPASEPNPSRSSKPALSSIDANSREV